MRDFRIIPIKVGTLFHYRGEMSGEVQRIEKERMPILMFYIDGADKKILVDTGGADPDSSSHRRFHAPYERLPEDEPGAALKAATGLDPNQIDIVVLTHLHWDHCCNNHLFPQAEFHVQRSELHAAIDPVPRFEGTYESFSAGGIPPWARQETKWRIVDGDADLVSGIRLIHIPGHSKGLQGVLVETAGGPHFLASDAVPLYDNIRGEKWIPSPMCLDLEAYYASLEKIRRLGAVIVPSHDAEVLRHKCFPIAGGGA